MTAESFPYKVSPEARYLLVIAIGTPERIKTFKQTIHARGYAKVYEWSKPQLVNDEPSKVMIALNRIMP